MQFNYNINPLDIGAYFRGLESYQKRQANQIALDQAEESKRLAQAAASGDQTALKQLATIDPQTANQLIQFQQAQKPKAPDMAQLGGDLAQLKGLAAGQSPMLGTALQTMLAKYSGTGFENDIEQWAKQYQQDPNAAIAVLDSTISALTPQEDDKTKLDFLKEERSVARDEVKNFNKRVQEIRGSYGKIESLLSKDKPTRADISAAITSMARLVSPGIVTEQDFQSLTGSGAPLPTIIAELRGLGQDGVALADALNQSIDPTNPEFFKKDAFLDTARNVAGSEIPALIDAYEQARERAERAGIKKERINAVFGENKNYLFARGFSGKANKSIVGATSPVLGRKITQQEYDKLKESGFTDDVIRQRLGI